MADPQGSSLHMRVKYGTIFSSMEKEGHKEKSPHRTMVEGIGLQWLTENFKLGDIDDSYSIKDQEVYDMAYYLVKHEGLFVGSSSALHVAAAFKLAQDITQKIESGELKSENGGSRPQILTLVCDDGNRHLSKFYNPKAWEAKNKPLIQRTNEEISDIKKLI